MFPYLIAGAIGYAVAKIFESDETPKYADGGSILLAPNGKPSNLTPEQYKLVRTPAFKQWFGDWENDPVNSSKVVDFNGEPLVCYHGTLFDFNIFERTIFGKFGKGMYFTSYIDSARKYAKNYENSRIIPVFLKSINLFKTEELFKDQIKNLPKNYDGIWSSLVWGNDYDYNEIDEDEIIVYSPEQIKLADGTNTTFDNNNPDIRYAGGGELKKTYQDLIEGYELSLEIETNKQKIKMYRDLIDGYKLALELEEDAQPKKQKVSAQPKKQKISAENKAIIKQLIKSIPKSTYQEYGDGGLPYELLVYANDDEFEVSEFVSFKNITELDKVIDKIITKHKNKLLRIEFRWSQYYGYPDSIVIYNAQELEGEEIQEEIKTEPITTEPIKINENTSIKQLLQAEGFQILNNGIVKYNDVEFIMWLQRKYLIKKGEYYIVEVGSPNEPNDKADMGLKIALLDNIENKSNRNKGNASFVLDKIVQASDLTNTTIQLIPKQMDKKGLTEKQLIEWYKKRGFEFNEDEVVMERKPNAKKEVIVEEPIQEVISEEVAKNDFRPTYLMTLDEYREKVTPIIQAYNKFLRKNKDWFVKPNYSGIAHYSLEEALEQIDDEDSAFAPTTKYSSYKNKKEKEKAIRENYSYEKTRKHDDKYTQEPTPPNLITENKEYIEKLKKYFSTYDLNSRVDGDETKSNKRAVRRAIDNNTYKELLTNKKVQLIELQKVSDSVGIRLPKSIFDKSTQNQMKYESELGKLLSNIPILSYQKLKELIEQIKVDLIPLEELVYEQEYARYSKMINENIGQTKKEESFDVVIPFWDEVYNTESEYKKEPSSRRDYTGNPYMESVNYIKLNSLKSNWEKNLSSWLKEYVANLKMAIIIAIMRNFQSINMPIKSIERLSIKVGKKGFEGSYKFTFENGSSFIMNFQGIGAGGYNIQSYHFRYLTNFSDVKLTDGSIGGTNYYQIINNFSFKK